jgi:chaperonin GroEL (HSP60 family)
LLALWQACNLMAHSKILSGATQLADAVGVTLGPKSKSVLMQNKGGKPTVCNDGVTISTCIAPLASTSRAYPVCSEPIASF